MIHFVHFVKKMSLFVSGDFQMSLFDDIIQFLAPSSVIKHTSNQHVGKRRNDRPLYSYGQYIEMLQKQEYCPLSAIIAFGMISAYFLIGLILFDVISNNE